MTKSFVNPQMKKKNWIKFGLLEIGVTVDVKVDTEETDVSTEDAELALNEQLDDSFTAQATGSYHFLSNLFSIHVLW